MAEKPIITASDLDEIGSIEQASASSQAFLENFDNIANGNISIVQRISGLSTNSFVAGYIDQVEDENFTPEQALAVFVADDFAAIKRIAGEDEAVQQAFVDVVVYLNTHFHGLSATLAENSPEARNIFEARGYDFSQYPALEIPDALTIENPNFAEQAYNRYQQLFDENQEFLATHAQTLHDGYAIMGIDMNIFRQMLVYDDFRFVREALARNDDNVNEIMLEVLETVDDRHEGFIRLMREQSEEIDGFFRTMYDEEPEVDAAAPAADPAPADPAPADPDPAPADPDPAAVDPPAEEAPAEPEPEAPVEEEAAPPPPPPPGASVLEGLIRPQIAPRTVLPVRDVKASVAEIYETLNNLPDDLEERQRVLNGIADDLGELAVGLRPEIAGDPRLQSLPPVPSTADSYEDNLGQLNRHLNDVMVTYNISDLSEYLIRASQTARVTARSLEAAREAEIEAEAEAARVAAEAETAAAPQDGEPDAAVVEPPEPVAPEPTAPDPDALEPEEAPAEDAAPRAIVPTPDYSGIVLPESRDPNNAATYGISNPDVDPAVDAEETLDVTDGEPEIVPEEVAPQEVAPTPPAPSTADLLRENTQSLTVLRLSELLDGHGYHNDRDGYTDYDAMQDAFNRAAELGLTSDHINAIAETLNSPDFILKTSAAIEALSAFNTEMAGQGNELEALMAFFDTLSMEDFVRDRAGIKDDHSTYDSAERSAVRDETLRIERDIIPRL